MMSATRRAAFFILAAVTMSREAAARDTAPICNADPGIIEACRWVRGVMYLGFEGNTFFRMRGDDVTYVLDPYKRRPFDERAWTHAGEFEFCRLKDTTISILADADENRTYYPHAHGCINAARVVIPAPDVKAECEYGGGPFCRDIPSKP